MQKKSLFKDLFMISSLVLSGLIVIAMVFFLHQKATTDSTFNDTLTSLATVFISLSGFLAAIIMAYLAYAATNLRSTRHSAINSLSLVTQKMHKFRSIVELLFRSKMWLPGLNDYIDDEFEGLNFFDVKEFYKGKSKLAIEFLQENHEYQDTETLYLELKSLLMTSVKDKKVSENINYPNVYSQDIVEKWLQHKSGSGLWYYFGYKYAIYKDALNLDNVFERHQDKIMVLANEIDSEVFEDSSFNEVFISKLGEYMSKEVMPKLFQFQNSMGAKVPSLISYLYALFLLLVLFGILMPLANLLFNLPVITLILGYSLVIGIIFFISLSFYSFISKEANS